MLTAIILAIVVPSVAGVGYLALRTRLPRLAADIRGIALQTVIIIVVLLAIAGAVAGVLLTRAGDVTTQLESQEVITGLVTNASSCAAYTMDTVRGTPIGTTCTWTAGTTGASPTDVTESRCDLVRGTYTPGDASASPATAATCVVTIT